MNLTFIQTPMFVVQAATVEADGRGRAGVGTTDHGVSGAGERDAANGRDSQDPVCAAVMAHRKERRDPRLLCGLQCDRRVLLRQRLCQE